MKLLVWIMVAAPILANAADNCVIEDRTVSTQNLVISERSGLRRSVVGMPDGTHSCRVDLRVRINNDWVAAMGQHTYRGDMSPERACGLALDDAERMAKNRVAKTLVVSERIVTCSDRTDTTLFERPITGTVGRAAQFRPHADYPKMFWHNGTRCRWFTMPTFEVNDIYQWQGVVCEIGNDQWVVVDKF